IEIKISSFYTKVQSPVLTDLKLRFEGNIKVDKTYPRELPDLFKGSTLTLLGQYDGNGEARVILEGKIKDKTQTFEYNLNFLKDDTDSDFIPPLWASRRIGFLLDQIRLHGEDKELVDEVTQLAKKYGIVSPYTSYLIIEEERDRVSHNEIKSDDRTLGAAIPATSDFFARSEAEYSGVKEKSGKRSVQASEEFQSLNMAKSYDEVYQGKDRLNYTDAKGNEQNLTQQVKNIQGRAIYNSGKNWVDSRIQTKKYGKAIKIQFASKEYFTLLKKEPLAADFLALGQNVRFILKDTIYEIYE
ncbi:MAG: trypsin, partial [bacterium]|nr:trypsin [bacterium]